MNRDLASARLPLRLHPDCRCDAVTSIEATAIRSPGGRLALHYMLTGEMDQIRMPAQTRPERRDGLWQHSCFEAFVRGQDPAYCEFNFAPSTQWAAYAFDDYRDGMHVFDTESPLIAIARTDTGFSLSTLLDLGGLAHLPPNSPWSLGLSAVIEEMDGRISYWALAHPEGKADFHHADCFTHQLPGM